MKNSCLRGYLAAAMLSFLSVGSANATTDNVPVGRPSLPDFGRASRIAADAGIELIGMRPCTDAPISCSLLAVRQQNREVLLLRLTGEPCDAAGIDCLSGLAVSGQWGGRRDSGDSLAASARISAKPGEDGGPSDPQDEAQAEATNEIIEALGDGKYDNNLDQFWSDLESIQTWDNPRWLEPDPLPPIDDSIRLTGGRGRDAAVLVSGRRKEDEGGKGCGAWVSYTSSTTTIDGLGNWIGNAVLDGCDSEVAVFAKDAAAQLVKPESRWSTGKDTLAFALVPPIRIPMTVWIVAAARGFDLEANAIESEIDNANRILEGSRCGIVIEGRTPIDRTTALADPDQEIGCGRIETILKPRVGFDPDSMNVYIVNRLASNKRSGVACRTESENVIILGRNRSPGALAHEVGHWLDLWHTTDMPLVDIRNIMMEPPKSLRDRMTAGQCYRANFSDNSYINLRGLRSGRTKRCDSQQDADGRCPGLKNEF
jgi:hypothetical protein